ncbi:PIN domain-containing protein [Kocuria rhizophila]|uniref:PIN domain-containing protein n=1 Tax=Kocuria rhizophila TaxID=72000 RepID=UPI000750614B|nr:PIN domain-containing protein [Kocuria rhizophila]KUP26872.1 toxin PIN [Kocuria rhizophila]
MARFSAVLDACVLVPIAQADTLLYLAEVGLYRPLWSDRILQETIRALEAIHPDMRASGAARLRAAVMNQAFGDACVEGWGELLESIELPDKDDRHVVAAAIQGRADLIVTANLKDFPARVLGRFNLEVQHPDEFFMNQLDLDPAEVMQSLQMQAAATCNPPLSVADVLERLERCGTRRFAEAARGQLWRL